MSDPEAAAAVGAHVADEMSLANAAWHLLGGFVDAIDEVERLREANAELRCAIQAICDWGSQCPTTPEQQAAHRQEGLAAFDRAKEALRMDNGQPSVTDVPRQIGAFVSEVVRQTAATLTAEQANSILYLTPRAPERKPRNFSQGVCLRGLSSHELAPGIFVSLTEETRPLDRWSPFRLTPFGVAVRRLLAEDQSHAA